ncbi:MAG: iron-sulfur cluster assembly accessory protein [Pirellulales bacterium]|nr:iron-sulfur cluster assembly accessory protein [Pirellulales bacterium]
MSITITEAAAGEIKRHMESENVKPGDMLRIGIAGGGCAGLQYSLGFDDNFNPKVDARFDQHGIPLIAAKKMALHLEGTTIDFRVGPMGSGFAIDNPNVPRGGGCPGCQHH